MSSYQHKLAAVDEYYRVHAPANDDPDASELWVIS